jgi:hypothetical protein
MAIHPTAKTMNPQRTKDKLIKKLKEADFQQVGSQSNDRIVYEYYLYANATVQCEVEFPPEKPVPSSMRIEVFYDSEYLADRNKSKEIPIHPLTWMEDLMRHVTNEKKRIKGEEPLICAFQSD